MDYQKKSNVFRMQLQSERKQGISPTEERNFKNSSVTVTEQYASFHLLKGKIMDTEDRKCSSDLFWPRKQPKFG